jgi:hypothetical protein
MLLVDDILLFPMRGMLWLFEEIRDAAEHELRQEAKAITLQLQQLYGMLESKAITEAEFDVREAKLLDRLDQLQEEDHFLD